MLGNFKNNKGYGTKAHIQSINKFKASPSILDLNGDKIIMAGSYDDSFYAINPDGSKKWSITKKEILNLKETIGSSELRNPNDKETFYNFINE